jgi:hypothetical protein
MLSHARSFFLRALAPLALFAALSLAAALGSGCNPPPAQGLLSAPSKHKLVREYAPSPFTEQTLKNDWRPTSGTWTVENGRLVGQQLEKDMPELDRQPGGTEALPFALIWLDKPLPHEFSIRFRARGVKNPSDINVLFCADGQDLSGYDLVLGGFNNFKHQLGWFPKSHDFGSREGLDKVKPGSLEMREYEIEIERTELEGIRVFLDQIQIMEDDDDPKISDDDMRYFAFYTWDNKVEFWDIEIQDRSPAAQGTNGAAANGKADKAPLAD